MAFQHPMEKHWYLEVDGDVEQAIEKLTREIRDAHVDVKRVFIEAERSGSRTA